MRDPPVAAIARTKREMHRSEQQVFGLASFLDQSPKEDTDKQACDMFIGVLIRHQSTLAG